ncbi:MAG: ABC transporter ATP-binding protein [Kouleothrix sp.]|jgi:ABC-2 type transport system ATP-binding protein|nr:ABC transporter ATP-binding protein [Kouleothrix sp.]
MANLVIETAGLRKIYGAKVAVADLTLAVPPGEVFGFLGPNGAGKSTSVKMLLGLVAPSGGTARLLGATPGDQQVMARVGFLPEHFRFHEWLQARELLDVHARLYRIDAATRRQRITALLEQVGLAEHAARPIAGFSKGMLQRIGLAQALLNEPELVFLDEPTSALDPFGRMLVRTIIRDLKARGTTVFLNSHLLSEVEATCDRVSFIRAGRVLQTLRLADTAAGRLQVELRVDVVTPELIAALRGLAPDLQVRDAAPASGTLAEQPGTLIDLSLPNDDMLPTVAERTLESGARLYALTPRRMSLEQIFLEVVGSQDSGQ